jgi:hypothetical protein
MFEETGSSLNLPDDGRTRDMKETSMRTDFRFCRTQAPKAVLVVAALCFAASESKVMGADPVPPLTETGFQSIFDGKTLTGWDCDPDFWRVEQSAIVGETKMDHQPKQNTFCIWKGGQPANFDLKLQYKLTGVNDGNSGIQYRSTERPDVAKWVLQGYQADIDLVQKYTGQIYEERGRTFLALRGQVSTIPNGQKPGAIGTLGTDEELKSLIKVDDWNDVEIIARGNMIMQLWNGRLVSELIDDDVAGRKMSGKLGIQVHRLPNAAMKIQARNIRLKIFAAE